MTQAKTQHFGFLLMPNFPMACLTSAIEPIRAANEICGFDAFKWTLISETGDKVTASAQVQFQPDQTLDQVEGLDRLFILASPTSQFQDPKRSNGTLRKLARHGMSIGAVSGGVFPLARSGLLDNQSETSVHWCYKAAFVNEFPQIKTNDDVLVLNPRCMTVSGAAAAFDLMLHLIAEQLGKMVMTEVACWFQHPLVRSEGVNQALPSFTTESTADGLHNIVSEAIQIFTTHIEDPLSIADVADLIGVSARQLERTFKTSTQQSPGQYYRDLRMRAARQLLIYSRESLNSIANSVGYAKTSALTRHYQESFGITPQEERNRINVFRVTDNRPIPSS